MISTIVNVIVYLMIVQVLFVILAILVVLSLFGFISIGVPRVYK